MQIELIDHIENYQEQLIELYPDLISYLLAGDLQKFENELYQLGMD